jgi:hypothetical protein
MFLGGHEDLGLQIHLQSVKKYRATADVYGSPAELLPFFADSGEGSCYHFSAGLVSGLVDSSFFDFFNGFFPFLVAMRSSRFEMPRSGLHELYANGQPMSTFTRASPISLRLLDLCRPDLPPAAHHAGLRVGYFNGRLVFSTLPLERYFSGVHVSPRVVRRVSSKFDSR